MANNGENETDINYDYINELRINFSNVNFNRIQCVRGKYITNPKNESLSNDYNIFKESQFKRVFRFAPFVSETLRKKLSYFSQEEDKDETKIYKFDSVQSLQAEEKYAIQNIGHATELIQIQGFNVLTDPIFNDLSWLLYPEKTRSHPSIENLPQINVIILSHNHRDHINKESLETILEYHKSKHWPQPQLFVPLGDKQLLKSFGFTQVAEVEWYTRISVSKDITNTVNFISVPADHRSGRSGIDHHRSLVTGWVINPEGENVIFKFSGDTRPLSDNDQRAVDAILWNEIKKKTFNKRKNIDDIEIPDIICIEPSGPNYTRSDMDITHQSTSYSALLKFLETENFVQLSGRSFQEFLQKIKTIMMHHNKYELGPDRFNEGLFVLKKLIRYLELNKEDLCEERARQKEKLEQDFDKKRLKKLTSFISRPSIASLPNQTSLLIRAKDFIITEILETTEKLESLNKEYVQEYFKEYLIKNTVFPKIGERLNKEQILNLKFDIENVQKYNGKTTVK